MLNFAQPSPQAINVPVRSVPLVLKTAEHLMQKGQYRMALAGLLPVLQEGSLDPSVLDKAASCYFQLGDSQTAISLLEMLTQMRPDIVAAWGKLAAMKQTVGDKQGAIEGYRKVLKGDPNSVYGLSALNRLEPFKSNSQKVARLRKLSKSKKLSNIERSVVFNTLGQCEQTANRTNSAFKFFSKAKAAQKAEFLPDELDALVDGQTECFHRSATLKTDHEGPRVVFVVGMPRSGTTLVENILSRHSIVGTVGESRALSQTLQVVRQHVKDTQRGAESWDWFGKLTELEISIFRQHYFELISQNATVNHDVIVDKMPRNSFHLGLAHVLMPDAKFVFMSRHPLDVGLSNFSTSLDVGNEFSCRLEWIGRMTQVIYRSIEDYKEKLPDQLRIQSYEGLVTNPEAQIKALLEHAELPWQDDCLSPQDAVGAIRTASVDQAREKINTRALGKWQAYQEQLQPLVEALGGPNWIEAWREQDQIAATR
ncbi:hypothetical protein DL239_18605 [Sedimentitalea sp. CY04]|uniref:Tetratricopeptide repeat protein n=1 Tax=Parasedimentitalea denitrificans TaxID=2211118 RepID=A0ABX0WBD2_9RHOB|nr:sulfotransferase [Sedimentitalea sp. CY04]NIZ62981.1 hypothetical protein [Sedimentitalea sp. CY04]